MKLIELLQNHSIENIKQFLKDETLSSSNSYTLENLAFHLENISNTISQEDFNEVCQLCFEKYDICESNSLTAFLAQEKFEKVYDYYMNHTEAKALWITSALSNKTQKNNLFPFITTEDESYDVTTHESVQNIVSNYINYINQNNSIYYNKSYVEDYKKLQHQIDELQFNEDGSKTLSYSENWDYYFINLLTDSSLVLPMQCVVLNKSYVENDVSTHEINEILTSLQDLKNQYHFKSLQFNASLNLKETLYQLKQNIVCVKEFFNLDDSEIGEGLLSFTVHSNDTQVGRNHIHDNLVSGLYALQAKSMLSSPALRKSTFLHEYTHFRQNLAFENNEEFKNQFNSVYETLKLHKTSQEEVVQLIIDSVCEKMKTTQELSELIHGMLNQNLSFSEMKDKFTYNIEQNILPNYKKSNVLFHIETRLEAYSQNPNESFEVQFLHKLDNQNQNAPQSYWERADEVHARMNEAALDFESHYHSMYEFTKSAFENTKPKLFAFNQLLIENYRMLKQKLKEHVANSHQTKMTHSKGQNSLNF